MTLTIIPLTLRRANAFVAQHHRHNDPARGCKFCIGATDEGGNLRGVLIAGRPIARALDDGSTIEITRTATDGTKNANSFLYAAAWRAAQAMGYLSLVTYTQAAESGASMRAIRAHPVRQLPPRKDWSESSVKLKHLRTDLFGQSTGQVERTLWRMGQPLSTERSL